MARVHTESWCHLGTHFLKIYARMAHAYLQKLWSSDPYYIIGLYSFIILIASMKTSQYLKAVGFRNEPINNLTWKKTHLSEITTQASNKNVRNFNQLFEEPNLHELFEKSS